MKFRVTELKPYEDKYEAIHRALLSGLLGNIAQQDEGRRFNAARNRKAQVFPASGQYKKPPKWLVAAELVETSQVFARQCAPSSPAGFSRPIRRFSSAITMSPPGMRARVVSWPKSGCRCLV